MLATNQLIIFTILALVAEVLGTIGGFGSSLFFVPVASYFLDFHSVLGITALFHVMSNLTKIGMFRKGYDKNLMYSMGIPAVVCVVGGAVASKYLPSNYLEIILASLLIFLSIMLLLFRDVEVKPTTANSFGGGVLSGFMAGMVGTGGAIRGVVMAAFNLPKEIFIATSAVIDLAIDASRSIVYASQGYVHTHDLYLLPILLVVTLAGTYLGKLILNYVSNKQFKTFVLFLVLITGIVTLYKVLA
ncbi:MAG: sulfite exporter TauE/SafE family protein [Chitinophagales bacterium]